MASRVENANKSLSGAGLQHSVALLNMRLFALPINVPIEVIAPDAFEFEFEFESSSQAIHMKANVMVSNLKK